MATRLLELLLELGNPALLFVNGSLLLLELGDSALLFVNGGLLLRIRLLFLLGGCLFLLKFYHKRRIRLLILFHFNLVLLKKLSLLGDGLSLLLVLLEDQL